jgi:hypothetical protein
MGAEVGVENAEGFSTIVDKLRVVHLAKVLPHCGLFAARSI